MSSALNNTLCRVTVIGPDRRVDLAVPAATPVTKLLPLLLRHTSAPGRHPDADAAEGTWVLQRLGEPPFEPTGTPESLDWLEGEELHLRQAENPLPELDFDDLAEGIATMVNRRTDRWQPEHHRRPLFLALSVLAAGTAGAVLADRGPMIGQVIAAGVLATLFLAAAVAGARRLTDRAYPQLFGFVSAFFAALGASSAFDGDPDGVIATAPAVLASAVAVTVVAALLLVAQRTFAPRIRFAPFLTLGMAALGTALILLLREAAGLDARETAAAAIGILLVLILIAPQTAVKLSRLRGPQLPKTGAEMSYDIEPASLPVVATRTDVAETCLTAAMVALSLILPVLFFFAVRLPGWPGWTLVLAASSAILLRSRTLFGFWQRNALVAAGAVGHLMVIMSFSATMSPGWRYVLFAGLITALVPLLLAASRPWPRRLLPFWEYLATILDVTTTLAVLPVLAQVLGWYGWARGLFG